MRKTFLATSALVSTALAAPVLAQETPADDGIGEIVITAQRKTEALQDAAVAIDAVQGEALIDRGITDPRSITKMVPSLTITNGGGQNASLFLRGVGNRTNNAYNDPAVAISYDGVYVARPAALTGAAFYDLERIEVLKGPQGILYGRNATGGALNILPARPRLGEQAAGISVGLGNYQTQNFDGYFNAPVGDRAAVRVAGTRQSQDGINRDGTDDRDVWSLRGQFLYEPSDTLTVRVGADYTKVGGRGPGNHYLGNYSPSPAGYVYSVSPFDLYEGMQTAAANAYRTTLRGAPGFGFLQATNRQTFIDMEYWGINAEIMAETSLGTVSFIPAYRKDSGSVAFNGPAFNTALNTVDDEQLSLELRLSGEAGSVAYVAGAYHLRDDAYANNEFNQEFVLPIQQYDHSTKSWAVFGQLTYSLTERMRLLGGLRYTQDRKSMDGIINNFITFCGGLPPNNRTPPAAFGQCSAASALPRYPNFLNVPDTIGWLSANGWIAAGSAPQPNTQVFPLVNGLGTILKTYSPVVATRDFSRVTGKASIEYDVTADSLLYATYETGYRSGGLQLAEGRPTYEPEFLDAFTVGSKNRFLDDNLQVNFEGFYWKYKDQQITYFTVDTSGTLINSNENAGKVDIRGFDLDVIYKPARNTTLSAKAQYLDAQYKDLHLYTASPRDNIGCPSTAVTYGSNPRYPATATNVAGTAVRAGGQPVKDFNCSGNQALFAPDWTLNLGVEQVFPVGSTLEFVGRVDTSWRDAQNGGFEFLPFQRIADYWTTDASVALREGDGGWNLSAYVLNIEDKRRLLFPQQSPIGMAVSTVSAPRTYGLRFSAEF